MSKYVKTILLMSVSYVGYTFNERLSYVWNKNFSPTAIGLLIEADIAAVSLSVAKEMGTHFLDTKSDTVQCFNYLFQTEKRAGSKLPTTNELQAILMKNIADMLSNTKAYDSFKNSLYKNPEAETIFKIQEKVFGRMSASKILEYLDDSSKQQVVVYKPSTKGPKPKPKFTEMITKHLVRSDTSYDIAIRDDSINTAIKSYDPEKAAGILNRATRWIVDTALSSNYMMEQGKNSCEEINSKWERTQKKIANDMESIYIKWEEEGFKKSYDYGLAMWKAPLPIVQQVGYVTEQYAVLTILWVFGILMSVYSLLKDAYRCCRGQNQPQHNFGGRRRSSRRRSSRRRSSRRRSSRKRSSRKRSSRRRTVRKHSRIRSRRRSVRRRSRRR